MRTGWLMGVALAVLAGPALADVKSGVDAWTRGDYKRAVEEWRAPAVAGDADAQFNLGQAYKLGRGVPLDPALARSWFLKAARQGHAQAGDNYGLALFENGEKAEAVPWLEKSVARGEARAQLVLGTMLFNGDGVPRDYPRAYGLMTRASQKGLRSASDTLAQMDQYISPVDRQQGVALAQRYAAEEDAVKMAEVGRRGAARDMTGSRRVPAGDPGLDRMGAEVSVVPHAATMAPRPVARVPAPPAPGARVAAEASPAPHRPAPSPAAAVTGRWKIQLGAFRDEGNARSLWSSVAGRLPGAHPIYATGGGVTRLQAGPFAGKAEAQRACTATRQTCVVVAP